MRLTSPLRRALSGLAALIAVLACGTDGAELPTATEAPNLHRLDRAEWSEPVNLEINSSANDFNPSLSPDGHSLYFNSPNRPGNTTPGVGDIWVAQRDCPTCPWNEPLNLSVINTEFTDATPKLSDDGHLLFFASNRPGGSGGNDIWVSRRSDPRDDFDWEPPVNLGPEINSPLGDENPEFVSGIDPRVGTLYFQRGPGPTFGVDLYVASVTRRGRVLRSATVIPELSVANANDGGPSISRDGRVIYFWSFGPGRPGLATGTLFFATRRGHRDPWSEPEPLAIPPNSIAGGAIQPNLSKDERTLFFISMRPGGKGGQDIWMSTRLRRGDRDQ